MPKHYRDKKVIFEGPRANKKRRKPLEGTGGYIAMKGGSVKTAFKKIGPLRERKK